MDKVSLDNLLSLSPENEAETILQDAELKRKIAFLADKKVGLKEIYDRLFYKYKKNPHYESARNEEIKRENRLERLTKYAVYSGVLSGLSSMADYSFLNGRLTTLPMELFASSFLLFMTAFLSYNAYKKNAAERIKRYENNFVDAIKEVYLIKSKEYLNVL
ncbi:hypothetical protein M1137_03470 [Candidatus Parvarchaeota archaeon]|jgi:hypothetical protein|nr:hypothetical protein [Candidatus Parvarchaeota archaeon]